MYIRKGIRNKNSVWDGHNNIKLTQKQVLIYNFCISPRTYEEIVSHIIFLVHKKRFSMKKEEINQVILQLKSLGILIETDDMLDLVKNNRIIAINNDKIRMNDKEIYYAIKINSDMDCLINRFGECDFINAILRMLENKNICIM